jgi:PhoPQ-activated pathogenicity-related protein
LRHTPLVSLAVLLSAAPVSAEAPPTALADYVAKEDKSFLWKLDRKTETDAGAVYDLAMVSQTWQGHVWDHALQVFVPKGAKPQATVVLWNQGGTPNAGSGALGMALAAKVGAPVAFLYGVPKQPLYDGKKEDALIAETFVRFLETKDATWPLLFPMVKSVVRAMDAVQAFAKQEWQFEVKQFVVTGASKRGWTSWLTAATGDPRVKAIAPLVIDTLNMPVQMKNQVSAFGKPSEMIRDYTERKLVPIPDTPEATQLWQMVDPWVYRDKITVPKMIINGANDPYWPLDALNSYWADLKGEKYVTYVPNAGHDLRETDKDGRKELFPTRGVNALAAFCKCQVFDKKMPTMNWKLTPTAEGGELEIVFEGECKLVRQWGANSPTRDFRSARWTNSVLSNRSNRPLAVPGAETLRSGVKSPAKDFRAIFLETEFEVDGLRFTLCTGVQILEAKK